MRAMNLKTADTFELLARRNTLMRKIRSYVLRIRLPLCNSQRACQQARVVILKAQVADIVAELQARFPGMAESFMADARRYEAEAKAIYEAAGNDFKAWDRGEAKDWVSYRLQDFAQLAAGEDPKLAEMNYRMDEDDAEFERGYDEAGENW